jgi:TolB-like protein/Tfp pilus assembly protein PilF
LAAQPSQAQELILDLGRYQLRRGNRVLRLEKSPMELLVLLAQREGQLVTRQEIVSVLWGDGVFVDAEHGINTAVHKVRQALKDDPDHPRYLETVVGKGYRFVGRVTILPARASSRRVMLAALPFETRGGDPDQDYFGPALSEEILTQLAKLEPDRLGVIARTSTIGYKGTSKSVEQIGNELGVDFVLAGTVRTAAGTLHISVQLIRVRDQSYVWVEDYERSLQDILAVQVQIAQAVARQIGLRLTRPQNPGPAASAQPLNLKAHEAYLRGRYLLRKFNCEATEGAIEHFREAVGIDPTYALAYASLAEAYYALSTFHRRPRDVMPLAKAAATNALALDETVADAHASLGFVNLKFDWNWAAAQREFIRALELNANLAHAHLGYAACLVTQGRFADGFIEVDRAYSLDPLSPHGRGDGMWYLFVARRYDDAVVRCRRTLELEPDHFYAHSLMGVAYSRLGRHAEAIEAAMQGRQLTDSPVAATMLAFVYAEAGKRDDASTLLQELIELAGRRYVCCYNVAVVYAALGNKEQAFKWLEKAYRDRSD